MNLNNIFKILNYTALLVTIGSTTVKILKSIRNFSVPQICYWQSRQYEKFWVSLRIPTMEKIILEMVYVIKTLIRVREISFLRFTIRRNNTINLILLLFCLIFFISRSSKKNSSMLLHCHPNTNRHFLSSYFNQPQYFLMLRKPSNT